MRKPVECSQNTFWASPCLQRVIILFGYSTMIPYHNSLMLIVNEGSPGVMRYVEFQINHENQNFYGFPHFSLFRSLLSLKFWAFHAFTWLSTPFHNALYKIWTWSLSVRKQKQNVVSTYVSSAFHSSPANASYYWVSFLFSSFVVDSKTSKAGSSESHRWCYMSSQRSMIWKEPTRWNNLFSSRNHNNRSLHCSSSIAKEPR